MITLIHKSDSSASCLELAPAAKKKDPILRLRCNLLVLAGRKFVKFAAGTPIALPEAMAPGCDYIVTASDQGDLMATPRKPAMGVSAIGGFHFAPGGNAGGRSGGDGQPQINAWSCWDLLWRPACSDPSGMTLVVLRDGRKIWVDIYLCSTLGQSRHGATIADGRNHPKIPAAFGGDGTAEYERFSCFEATQLAAAVGKCLLRREEFEAAAHGVLEQSSADDRAEATAVDPARTSRWGLMQATGQRYIWGALAPLQEFEKLDTDDEIGTTLLGGLWDSGVNAGSRSCNWNNSPSGSSFLIGARFRCDHLSPV